jgi:predicted DNA-binding antitoxin AbrB/MazE fold protein
MVQLIEAVFENGVFRPLQPVQLPERQHVTLSLSESERSVKNGKPVEEVEMEHEVDYQPLR